MKPEACDVMALRRVSEGGVTVADRGYVHRGSPVSGELAEACVALDVPLGLAVLATLLVT